MTSERNSVLLNLLAEVFSSKHNLLAEEAKQVDDLGLGHENQVLASYVRSDLMTSNMKILKS